MDNIQNTSKPNILLVEDNPADIRLIKEAFKEYGIKNKLYQVNNGVEALKFLYQKNQYNDMPRPDLIMLDLNLPRKDGWEVLKEVKKDEKLKAIPVIIISVSTDPETIFKAYHLQANCVMIKPIDVNEFNKCIKGINDFWLDIVQLPINSRV
jgi:CheY-like chemotaxis protein